MLAPVSTSTRWTSPIVRGLLMPVSMQISVPLPLEPGFEPSAVLLCPGEPHRIASMMPMAVVPAESPTMSEPLLQVPGSHLDVLRPWLRIRCHRNPSNVAASLNFNSLANDRFTNFTHFDVTAYPIPYVIAIHCSMLIVCFYAVMVGVAGIRSDKTEYPLYMIGSSNSYVLDIAALRCPTLCIRVRFTRKHTSCGWRGSSEPNLLTSMFIQLLTRTLCCLSSSSSKVPYAQARWSTPSYDGCRCISTCTISTIVSPQGCCDTLLIVPPDVITSSFLFCISLPLSLSTFQPSVQIQLH